MAAASTWGHPTATKRVLLLHGLTRSSHFWHRIGRDFASRGYYVVAPDLLGHGFAKRGSVYTMAGLADDLRPWLSVPSQGTGEGGGDDGDEPPFHIIIGHSLGGVVAAALSPLIASFPSSSPARPISVVLVDPPLEVDPEPLANYRRLFLEMVAHPPTPEASMKENPLWTKEDAMIASMSIGLCDTTTVEGVFDHNTENNTLWSFSHYLSMVPDNVRMMVLAADPEANWASTKEEQVKGYPRVASMVVQGASHWIPLERPELVIETAIALTREERNDAELLGST